MINLQTIIKTRAKIEGTIADLTALLEKDDFKGWEPYELPEFFQRQSRRSRIVLTQLLRLFPVSWFQCMTEKKLHPKAAALFAQAFLNLYEITDQPAHYEKALFFLEWLIAHRSAQSKNFSIGNLHSLNMKSYQAAPETPSPLITCFAVEAFLKAFEARQDRQLLKMAMSGMQYFLEELPVKYVSANECYFVYHPNHDRFIPNAPAVICGILAHGYAMSKDWAALTIIKNNLNYIARWQQRDGSWLYYPGAGYVDSFHTAFILEALARFQFYTSDASFERVLARGLTFYAHAFFKTSGEPIHKKRSGFPLNVDSWLTKIDVRDIAMGLAVFSSLALQHPNYFPIAMQLLNWCLDNFKSNNGYFFYQKIPFNTIPGPFVRMQAWMLYGLSKILKALKFIQKKFEEETNESLETKFIT